MTAAIAETMLWLAGACLLIAVVSLVLCAFLWAEVRAFRREDADWKKNFGGRFIAMESRSANAAAGAVPQIQPTFTARDSAQSPDYGEPPETATPGSERATWAPPSRKR